MVLRSSEDNLDMQNQGAGVLGCLCPSKSTHLETITYGS